MQTIMGKDAKKLDDSDILTLSSKEEGAHCPPPHDGFLLLYFTR